MGPIMKTFEQDSYTTHCGSQTEWKELRKKFPTDEKVSVLDLRTAVMAAENELEKMPDGWLYRRLPVQASTVSEQDVDVFRREQRRNGKMIVVAESETPGALLAMADLARLARTGLDQDVLKKLDDLDDYRELKEWLDHYLERHATTEEVGVY